ncbi:hypothetical protein BDZ89DRAFT_1077713 [Hymenopellis radicata]|nr:hypothetical protein BDZ89DRAFT_1077713 [Hymenopellis radicata]
MSILANMTNDSNVFAGSDDNEHDGVPPDLEEKRRRNMIAARRSRRRKALYLMWLEGRVEELNQQLEGWKARTAAYEGLMQKHGLSVALE